MSFMVEDISVDDDFIVDAEEICDEKEESAIDSISISVYLVKQIADLNRVSVEYELISDAGPPHKKKYIISLKLGTEVYVGSAYSVKRAKQVAAADAVKTTSYRKPKDLKRMERMTLAIMIVNAICIRLRVQVRYSTVQAPFPNTVGVTASIGSYNFTAYGRNVQDARYNAMNEAIEALRDKEPEKKVEENLGRPDGCAFILRELAERRGMNVNYHEVDESGPAHMKVFRTRCRVGEYATVGTGPSKKASKNNAAFRMIKQMNGEDEDLPEALPNAPESNRRSSFVTSQEVILPRFIPRPIPTKEAVEPTNRDPRRREPLDGVKSIYDKTPNSIVPTANQTYYKRLTKSGPGPKRTPYKPVIFIKGPELSNRPVLRPDELGRKRSHSEENQSREKVPWGRERYGEPNESRFARVRSRSEESPRRRRDSSRLPSVCESSSEKSLRRTGRKRSKSEDGRVSKKSSRCAGSSRKSSSKRRSSYDRNVEDFKRGRRWSRSPSTSVTNADTSQRRKRSRHRRRNSSASDCGSQGRLEDLSPIRSDDYEGQLEEFEKLRHGLTMAGFDLRDRLASKRSAARDASPKPAALLGDIVNLPELRERGQSEERGAHDSIRRTAKDDALMGSDAETDDFLAYMNEQIEIHKQQIRDLNSEKAAPIEEKHAEPALSQADPKTDYYHVNREPEEQTFERLLPQDAIPSNPIVKRQQKDPAVVQNIPLPQDDPPEKHSTDGVVVNVKPEPEDLTEAIDQTTVSHSEVEKQVSAMTRSTSCDDLHHQIDLLLENAVLWDQNNDQDMPLDLSFKPDI